ncbi:hypothetical protein [Rhodopirellula sp. P2]|uniref:hypothetical protein n=1 Tax=Rhodopirellula sp. P2 TaxID=2127060 RepID=UPI0023685FF9|nr:hypothetical protein [Rhodopirellula sp. P2]WDQ16850.1 hypothetical protein PSR62_25040 [Rhodopirellula sp. P2]
MSDPSRLDRFAQRSLSQLGVFEYQLLQLRTMSAPLDAAFVDKAFTTIRSICRDAEAMERAAIVNQSQNLETMLQTTVQQVADQGCSPDASLPNASLIGQMLQDTHRLRLRIQSDTDAAMKFCEEQPAAEGSASAAPPRSSHPDTRKTISNAGTTKTPAPKRARPEFTIPPTIKRLEDLLDQIQAQLDDCLADGECLEFDPKPENSNSASVAREDREDPDEHASGTI